MALFLFPLAKTALACLTTALFMALRPPFPFRQAHYAQVFPLKLAPFCKLSAGLGSINKSSLFFLFSFSRHSVLSFYLNLSGRNCLLFPPLLFGYYRSPDISFSRRTTRHKAWWSAEVEQAVSERRKAFAADHRSDED